MSNVTPVTSSTATPPPAATLPQTSSCWRGVWVTLCEIKKCECSLESALKVAAWIVTGLLTLGIFPALAWYFGSAEPAPSQTTSTTTSATARASAPPAPTLTLRIPRGSRTYQYQHGMTSPLLPRDALLIDTGYGSYLFNALSNGLLKHYNIPGAHSLAYTIERRIIDPLCTALNEAGYTYRSDAANHIPVGIMVRKSENNQLLPFVVVAAKPEILPALLRCGEFVPYNGGGPDLYIREIDIPDSDRARERQEELRAQIKAAEASIQ